MQRTLRQCIVKLLLLVYLFSSYLGATHIHKEAFSAHDNCKVCIVVKNLHSADNPSTPILPFISQYKEALRDPYRNCFLQAIYKGFDAHAPPLLS